MRHARWQRRALAVCGYRMDITPELRERIKTAVEAGPFTRHVGLVVEAIEEGYVRARLPFREVLVRSYGIHHGGAILTLMDVASGVASSSAHEGAYDPGVTNVTIAASTQFMGTAPGKDLVAEARCTKSGKTISFVDVEVRADAELVAKGSFTFKVTRVG